MTPPQTRHRFCAFLILSLAVVVAGGCDEHAAGPDAPTLDGDYGKPLLGVPPEPDAAGKADVATANGPLVAGLHANTDAYVWHVAERWSDVTDEAGLAWPADSGLSWEQKYTRWVERLRATDAMAGYATFELTTPEGRTLPAPKLECAELAMFLRATFAMWHRLPFFMTVWSSAEREHIHFGHFGVVDRDGRPVAHYPRFSRDFVDHTAGGWDGLDDSWPSDPALRRAALASGDYKDDENGFLGEGAFTGAYLDALLLNKRAGHFLMRLLTHTGSMHLASSANTFDVVPEATTSGDLLLLRHDRWGIGHTIVLKHAGFDDRGFYAEAVFGSMPRMQPRWQGENASRRWFTDPEAGGPGTNDDGVAYAALGGGVKRWRVASVSGGRYVNSIGTTLPGDTLSPGDHAAIARRPARFEALFATLGEDAERAAILARIAEARDHLSRHPSSCSWRTRREDAFRELYTLLGQASADSEYRRLEDYVLPELDYDRSRTCCWNSSTPDMFDVALELNWERAFNENTAECQPVIPFTASNLPVFEAYLASLEAEGGWEDVQWRDWQADENWCVEEGVTGDVELPSDVTPMCDILEDVRGNMFE